ncbi:DUF4249 family protein [Marivirga salinae]|uniref:DUF4249 family protein n=1 Tax=Marivirga salinarum TaxID=3059078 RepID=A0AA51RBC2_9BACT|nr:DUF4249 family protein [Marivirga sp. BDSF4-3]WMN12046.1 DUF4249 family protein [Marivirga sp. BDSF4-3]
MNKLISTCFIISILCFSSCIKLLEDDFPEFDNDWIINNIMIAGDSIEVEITKTTSVNGEGNPPVEDAVVQLMVENETFNLTYDENSATYKLNQQIETSKDYHFEVFDALGELKSSFNQLIPPPQPILNIEHIDVAGTDDEGVSHPAIKIEVPNNPSKDYFYVNIRLLKIYDYEFEDDNRFEIFKIEDPILLNEGVPFPLFSNELMTGNSQEVLMNYTAGIAPRSNDEPWVSEVVPLVVELWTLNEAYYEFLKQNYQYENSRYPIIGSGNQAAISNFNNIEGAYGINAGYSFVKTDTIYPSGTENYFDQ